MLFHIDHKVVSYVGCWTPLHKLVCRSMALHGHETIFDTLSDIRRHIEGRAQKSRILHHTSSFPQVPDQQRNATGHEKQDSEKDVKSLADRKAEFDGVGYHCLVAYPSGGLLPSKHTRSARIFFT